MWWLLCVLTRFGKGKEEEEREDRGDLVAVLRMSAIKHIKSGGNYLSGTIL